MHIRAEFSYGSARQMSFNKTDLLKNEHSSNKPKKSHCFILKEIFSEKVSFVSGDNTALKREFTGFLKGPSMFLQGSRDLDVRVHLLHKVYRFTDRYISCVLFSITL